MRHLPLALTCSLVLLTACQAPPLQTPAQNQTQSPAQPPSSLNTPDPSPLRQAVIPPKLQTQAQVSAQPASPGHSTLSFTIGYRELTQGFTTQAIDCGSVAHARVQVSGVGMSTPLYATGSSDDANHMIDVENSCEIAATIAAVPYGPARIFQISLYDDQRRLIGGGQLAGVSAVNASTTNIEISYRQSVSANLIAGLIALGANGEFIASQVDLEALQTDLIDLLIGVQGNFPYTFTTDPSLLNLAALTSALQAANGNVALLLDNTPSLTVFSNTPQTLPVAISGFITGQPFSASLDDPLSGGISVSSNGTVNIDNVPPGTWNLTLAGEGYVTQRLSVTVNHNGTHNLGPITLLPPAPTFTSFDEGSDAFTFAGGSLVLTGTGFNATLGNNVIRIGGQLATVISGTGTTSLTVTVPSGLSGSQGVSLSIGELTTPLGTIGLDTPSVSTLTNGSAQVGESLDLAVSPLSADLSDTVVRFGEIVATNVSAISGGLRVEVPAGVWGDVDISVTTLGSVSSNTQSFSVEPEITAATASAGSIGDTFLIKGTGFGPSADDQTVLINGAAVSITSVDADGLYVTLPTGLYGSVPVTVTTTGNASEVFNLAITPVISPLSISSGVSGDVLSLTGSGFHPSAGSETVSLISAGLVATSVTPTGTSTTGMSITLPNLSAGVYTLTVAVGDQTSATRSITLIPKISAVGTAQTVNDKPALLRGALITISGTGFDMTTASNNSISFGDTAVTASDFSGADLQVVVPRTVTLGDLALTVTTNMQTSSAFTATVPTVDVTLNGGFN